MSGRVINLARREVAMAERDRLFKFLAAVEAARLSRLQVRGESRSDAAEYLALCDLDKAEGRLLELTFDPDLAAFLTCILEQVADIAEPRQ